MAGWNDPLSQLWDGWPACSLLIKVLKLGARLLLARRDDAVVINIDQALGLHLVDDVGGLLVLRGHLVVVCKLLLCSSDKLELSLDLSLPVRVSLLLVGYLYLGLSPLAAHLEHVGTDALGI